MDPFVFQGRGSSLSHSPSVSHTHTHIYICSYKHFTVQCRASTCPGSFFKNMFFAFFLPFDLVTAPVYVDLNNYASNRVLFDPCQFSLKPYVFSWHLYHIVALIQTHLSVCVSDWPGHAGIPAWLLVAALPVCLYSSADLLTQRSGRSLKRGA